MSETRRWRRQRGRKGWIDHERVSDSETDEKTEARGEGMISRPCDHLVALHSPKPRSLRAVPIPSQFSCTPGGGSLGRHTGKAVLCTKEKEHLEPAVPAVALDKSPHRFGPWVLHLQKKIIILPCLHLRVVLTVIKNSGYREDPGKMADYQAPGICLST